MNQKTFVGGVHPADSKHDSDTKPIEACPLPEQLIIPLSQHIGAPAEALVKAGDLVFKGQTIAKASAFVSVPIHASTSGQVIAVEPRLHPCGKMLPAIVIEADGEDHWDPSLEGIDPAQWTGDELRQRISDAGIVGMGGATFPTHVKLSPPEDKLIDTLMINGVECEPYLTADHRLMLEQSDKIMDGIDILRRVLGVKHTIVGIESNKPDAIACMAKAGANHGIQVQALEVKYPQGAEKQLIDALLGREVPSAGLPMDIGVVVQNVATAAAVSDAIRLGRPLVERVVTISGPAVAEAKNLRVRIGTPLSFLVQQCGGNKYEVSKIIMGGPMMGQSQLSLDAPAVRGTSGLLLFGEKDLAKIEAGPCIRCGRCVGACPLHLLPATIASYATLGMFDEAEAHSALDCMECGCCTYICPATRPLVQTLRHAKGGILAKRRRS
ncbi:MAG: electron transport complex subunit RsxC [Desulfuromonas sp.]|nr:electron transport complex subunit RsxC [Desulfuromonas sp.]